MLGSVGADRVAGQLRGYRECTFSGVTNSGRVWRKVPENDARSVLRLAHERESQTVGPTRDVTVIPSSC